MSLELLSLGMDFLGGMMGRKYQSKLYKEQLAQAQKQFNMQMNESVQRRVADARAAGVHPLFALGASVGASPTVSSAAEPQGDPLQSALTNMASRLGVIDQNRASAKRDEAEAALFDSERKRIEQDLKGGRGHDTEALQEVKVVPRVRGSVIGRAEYVPPQVAQSQRTGVAAGTHPEKIELVDEEGRTHTLQNPDLGLDEIAQIQYAYNKARFWTTDRIEDFIRFNRSMSGAAKKFFMEMVYPTLGRGRKLDPSDSDWISP